MNSGRDASQIEELLSEYGGFIRRKAETCMAQGARHDPALAVDDLYQAGVCGLIYAYRTFDEKFGVPFPAYAVLRVTYSIYDAYTRSSQVLRGQSAILKMFDDDKSALEQIYGRSVTQGELADFLGMPLLEFEKIFSRARGGVPELFSIQDVPVVSEQADQLVLRLEVLDHMRPAFARLTEQEQNVLAAVFYGGKSLAEVGTDFGLSKQRIGVIKNSALAKLRKKLPDFLRGTLCD